jgi:hypothetical protein
MEALKAELQKLQAQRSAVEADINARSDRLNEPGQPGMSGSLLDKEVRTCTAGQHAASNVCQTPWLIVVSDSTKHSFSPVWVKHHCWFPSCGKSADASISAWHAYVCGMYGCSSLKHLCSLHPYTTIHPCCQHVTSCTEHHVLHMHCLGVYVSCLRRSACCSVTILADHRSACSAFNVSVRRVSRVQT